MRRRVEQDPELTEWALRWSVGTHTHWSADETSLCMSVCILLGMMGWGTLLGPPTECRTPSGTRRGLLPEAATPQKKQGLGSGGKKSLESSEQSTNAHSRSCTCCSLFALDTHIICPSPPARLALMELHTTSQPACLQEPGVHLSEYSGYASDLQSHSKGEEDHTRSYPCH